MMTDDLERRERRVREILKPLSKDMRWGTMWATYPWDDYYYCKRCIDAAWTRERTKWLREAVREAKTEKDLEEVEIVRAAWRDGDYFGKWHKMPHWFDAVTCYDASLANDDFDSPQHCETCGVFFSVSLTKCGVEYELEHFEEYGAGLNADDAAHLLDMLEAAKGAEYERAILVCEVIVRGWPLLRQQVYLALRRLGEPVAVLDVVWDLWSGLLTWPHRPPSEAPRREWFYGSEVLRQLHCLEERGFVQNVGLRWTIRQKA